MREARRLSNPGLLYSIRKGVIKNDNDFQSFDAGWERLARSQYAWRLKRRLPHLLYSRCQLDHCELLMDMDENLAQPLLNDRRGRQRDGKVTAAELEHLLEADYIVRARGLEDDGERYVVGKAGFPVGTGSPPFLLAKGTAGGLLGKLPRAPSKLFGVGDCWLF